MKPFKIYVCISSSAKARRKMIATLASQLGLFATPGDANKMIKVDLIGTSIVDRYIILSENYDFKANDALNERLFNAALHGIAVIVGSQSQIPTKFNFITKSIYPEDFKR